MSEVSSEQQAANDKLVGVIVAIVGNLCISVSFQITKLTHMRNTENKDFTKIPMWWLGLFLMLGGEVGNFFAYGWAPATVVSPLGAVAVVSNCLLSRIFLKEEITVRNLIGVFFAIAGATTIAFTAPTSILLEDNPSNSTDVGDARRSGGGAVSGEYIYDSLVSWRAAGFLLGVLVSAGLLANPCQWKRAVSAELRDKYVVCNVMMCGLLGCITVMSAKGVATAFTQMVKGDFVLWVGPHCWLTWILIVSAIISIVGQVQFLNRAMMGFGASEVVPVYFVIFTMATVTAGMVLYLELNFGAWWRALFFVIGIISTFYGVYLVNHKHGKNAAKEEGEEEDVEEGEVDLQPMSAGGVLGESRVGLVARGKKSRMTPISEGKGDGWAGGGVVEADGEDLEQPPNGLQEGDVDVSIHSADIEMAHGHISEPVSPAPLSARSGRSGRPATPTGCAILPPQHTPRKYHSTQNTPRKSGDVGVEGEVPPRLSADHAEPSRARRRSAENSARSRSGSFHGSIEETYQSGIPLFDIARAVEYMRRQSASPALASISTPVEKQAPALDASSLEAGHGGTPAHKLRNQMQKTPRGSEDPEDASPSMSSVQTPTEPDGDVMSSVARGFGHILGYVRTPAQKNPSEGRRTPVPDEACSPSPVVLTPDPSAMEGGEAGEGGAHLHWGEHHPQPPLPPLGARGPSESEPAKPSNSKVSRRYERLVGSGNWEQAAVEKAEAGGAGGVAAAGRESSGGGAAGDLPGAEPAL